MTAFERYFEALKRSLARADLYDVWPDFEPQYDEQEYAWTTLRGLGEVLMLNCGQCDGPSDLRHVRCQYCSEKREQIAGEAYQKTTGRPKQEWNTIVLCRFHAR